MDETEQTPDATPWQTGLVLCVQCDTEWRAAWPVGAVPLECPACGQREGVPKAEYVALLTALAPAVAKYVPAA